MSEVPLYRGRDRDLGALAAAAALAVPLSVENISLIMASERVIFSTKVFMSCSHPARQRLFDQNRSLQGAGSRSRYIGLR